MENLVLKNKTIKVEPSEYLQRHFKLKKSEIEKVKIFKIKELPEVYRTQFDFLEDERLDQVSVVIIPDNLWEKGQPSESSAENLLILIKQSYFERKVNPDRIAWMVHELVHCQSFLDSGSKKIYQDKMETFAFSELGSEYTYPNNLVEQDAFTKQFKFLKQQGVDRDSAIEMLEKYYNEEDMSFFDRLLDGVYN